MISSLRHRRHELPSADGYRDLPTVDTSDAFHGAKSEYVTKALRLIAQNGYYLQAKEVLAVQKDMMNGLHVKGARFEGPTLYQHIKAKVWDSIKCWVTGERASHLLQLHIHCDNPRHVIPMKHLEQRRRDAAREVGVLRSAEDLASPADSKADNSLNDDIANRSWSSFLDRGKRKHQLASAHLYAGAVEASNACAVRKRISGGCRDNVGCDLSPGADAQADVGFSTYLHGGSFALSWRVELDGISISQATPYAVPGTALILICHKDEEPCDIVTTRKWSLVPESIPLVASSGGNLSVGTESLICMHGESETRMMWCLANVI